jgi:hypothetical protein
MKERILLASECAGMFEMLRNISMLGNDPVRRLSKYAAEACPKGAFP